MKTDTTTSQRDDDPIECADWLEGPAARSAAWRRSLWRLGCSRCRSLGAPFRAPAVVLTIGGDEFVTVVFPAADDFALDFLPNARGNVLRMNILPIVPLAAAVKLDLVTADLPCFAGRVGVEFGLHAIPILHPPQPVNCIIAEKRNYLRAQRGGRPRPPARHG